MKKFLAILVCAILAVSVMCSTACALDTEKKDLLVQFWTQPTSNWSWTEAGCADNVNYVALGEKHDIVWTDFSNFSALDTSADINYGLQMVDETLTAEGDTSTIMYTVSDMVLKAEGYDDVVISCAGTYTTTLTPKAESWGLSSNSATIAIDVTAVSGSSAAEKAAYFKALKEATLTVEYNKYNDEGSEPSAAPAEPETPDEPVAAPAEPEFVPEPSPAPEIPAKTGIVLAVLPMAIAACAVALSKKR